MTRDMLHTNTCFVCATEYSDFLNRIIERIRYCDIARYNKLYYIVNYYKLHYIVNYYKNILYSFFYLGIHC